MHSVQELQSAIPALSAKDQEFATSLASQWATKGNLSEKQMFWAVKFIERATNPAKADEPRKQIPVGDLTKITDLLAKAGKHVKFPSIVLSADTKAIRVYKAGPAAKVPGSINVVDPDTKDWFGRILATGAFEASPRIATPPAVIVKLRAFAADPAKVAGEDGRLNGRCCFCCLPLTDERSTEVGYGKKCAENYGLPWGEKAFAFTAE
jgi:hypothetical protein